MLIFVVGGASSGKSGFALTLARGKRAFIATLEALDEEMEEKIKRHREERGGGWTLVEEPLRVYEALCSLLDHDTVLIDSVTVWVSNMLLKGVEGRGVEEEVARVLDLSHRFERLVLVSDEVGMGIVPENRLARTFRETLGRVNQLISRRAGEVYFVVSGIPMKIK